MNRKKPSNYLLYSDECSDCAKAKKLLQDNNIPFKKCSTEYKESYEEIVQHPSLYTDVYTFKGLKSIQNHIVHHRACMKAFGIGDLSFYLNLGKNHKTRKIKETEKNLSPSLTHVLAMAGGN